VTGYRGARPERLAKKRESERMEKRGRAYRLEVKEESWLRRHNRKKRGGLGWFPASKIVPRQSRKGTKKKSDKRRSSGKPKGGKRGPTRDILDVRSERG